MIFFIIWLDEQERVQKKTFTKWVNIYLSLHDPPLYVNDLFEDFQDGTKLIALIEVLSGQTLVCLRRRIILDNKIFVLLASWTRKKTSALS